MRGVVESEGFLCCGVPICSRDLASTLGVAGMPKGMVGEAT